MNLNNLMKQAQESEHLELTLLEAGGYDAPGADDLPAEAHLSAKQWLHRNALIGEETASGDFELTYDGQVLADDLYESRTNGERRLDLVLREILTAAEQDLAHWTVTSVDGREVTEREMQLVSDRIERWGLGKVSRAWGGEVIDISPNPAAAEALVANGALRDRFEFLGSTDNSVNSTTNITGGTVGGVMTGGTGNSMHVNQSITPLEAAGINAKIDEILNVLARDDTDAVAPLVTAVEEIRETVAEPAVTKQSLVQKIVRAISVAGSLSKDVSSVVQLGPMVTTAVPMLAQLMTMLGV